MYRIGVDIGGTSVKTAIFDEEYNIIQKMFSPFDKGRTSNETINDICNLINGALAFSGVDLSECSGIGIGSAGTCDAKNGVILKAYNLGFDKVPICELIGFRMNLPVRLANDADAAALGEAVAGSAKGKDSVLMVTLGTGIGAGLVIDKKIYSGCGNKGIEAGHMTIVAGGELCSCGNKGCFEAYASATALIGQAKRAAEFDGYSALNSIEEFNAKAVFEAADNGDATAKAVVDRYMDYLCVGITNYVNIYDPSVVVIGGGVSLRGEKLLEPLREYVKDHSFGGRSLKSPDIVASTLLDNAGLYGAAALFD